MEITLPAAPLVSDKIVLRPWEPEDAAWYVAARDEEVFRWTNQRRDLTVGQAAADIASYRANPTYASFAIAEAQSGDLLGNANVRPVDFDPEAVQVSYWLAAEARGQGYVSTAVRLLSRWAVAECGARSIYLFTLPGNIASQRVARAAGYEPAGELDGRAMFILDGANLEIRR